MVTSYLMSEPDDIVENHQGITGMSISDMRLRNVYQPITFVLKAGR